jgi:hypothetical protein
LLPFFIGAAIYILWRSQALFLFTWLRQVGLHAPMLALRAHFAGVKHLVPDFILYSLPDGLWLYAFTALMGFIWLNEPNRYLRLFWNLLPVFLAVGSEFGQRFRLIPGTFDWWDVVSYIAAWVPAVVSIHVFLSRTAERTPPGSSPNIFHNGFANFNTPYRHVRSLLTAIGSRAKKNSFREEAKHARQSRFRSRPV